MNINHFALQNNTDLPKITIVTPVKNSVKTLEKAIKSLIAQNYPNLEYLILDGNSSDGTVDIIKKYENFITYWHSKSDNGNVAAYLEGIKKASGEIIAFLNADDFYENNVLLKAGQEFKNHPELEIVSFRYRTLIQQDNNYKTIDESQVSYMELNKNKVMTSLGINARFFKKEIFYKYGFPQVLDNQNRPFISNDLEYMIRFVLNDVKNKTIDYVGYNYLSHNDSLTFAKNYQTHIRLGEDKIYIAQKFLNSNDFELPKIWKKTFTKWIKKYRALNIKYYLKQKEYKKAQQNLILGIKENGFLRFTSYLLRVFLRKKS